ncbi:hypothetical protein LDENG_00207000 [Lucifuga dentata]|nr:hypothetical protein LDENG_00207000 [Lucifuga dentata]
MTPSCPREPRLPGFPSISQLNPSEKQMIADQSPSAAEKSTSQEAPSCVKEAITPASVSAALTDEDNLKGNAEQNIDLSVDDGKSEIESLAVEETQTAKKSLDTSEPAVVLGWEVLEAEGTLTEKQEAKVEETPGLVKSIVGVLHKGYETVASILGPSGSTLAEGDNQSKTVSSSVDLEEKTHSDGFSLPSLHNITEKIDPSGELHFEGVHAEYSTEYPTTAEPYMWDVTDHQSASPSPASDSDDEIVVGMSIMKKWPPLTEADITEISKEDLEFVEKEEASVDQCCEKKRLLAAWDSAEDSGHGEGLLASHWTEAEQEEARIVSSSAYLDTGLQQTSTEEISLQPTSNESLSHDASYESREIILDKPSEHQKIIPVELPAGVDVPQRGRKLKRSIPKPQQKEFDHEKNIVPVRPVRRKDSLTPDRKQTAVGCVKKEVRDEIIPTQQAADHVQKRETEMIQTSADLVPPHRKRRDNSLPPEAPKKADVLPCLEAPRKPERRKGSVTRGRSAPVTDDQHHLNAEDSSVLRDFNLVPPEQTSSSLSGVPETIKNVGKPCQTSTKLIASQSVGEEDPTTKEHSQEADITATPQTNTERARSSPDLPEKDKDSDVNKSVQASYELIPALQTITPKPEPEPELLDVEPNIPVSIIKKIGLPQHRKKASKSGEINGEKGIAVQEGSQKVKDVVEKDLAEIKQPQTAGVLAKITSSQKSDEKSPDIEKDKPSLPVPRVRMKKHLSGAFPDDFTAAEGSSSQSACQDEAKAPIPSKAVELVTHQQLTLTLPSADQSSASVEATVPVRMRRSRLNVESKEKVEDGDRSVKMPDPDFPLPKPRVKKGLSGSFPDDLTPSSLPFSCLPDTNDTTGRETFQHRDQPSLPIPLPRPKKRLSATYSDSTLPAGSFFPREMESSQNSTEDTPVSQQEVKEGSVSLDSSVISEGSFVTIPGPDVIASELEQEVLVGLEEIDFPLVDSVEDITIEKVLEGNVEGWSFTDKPVDVDDAGKAAESELDKTLTSVVAAQDDWLYVEEAKDSKSMEINSKKERRDEEVDFGFVSVDVAAGCLEGERQRGTADESSGRPLPVSRGKMRLSGSYLDDSKSQAAGSHQVNEPAAPQKRPAGAQDLGPEGTDVC